MSTLIEESVRQDVLEPSQRVSQGVGLMPNGYAFVSKVYLNDSFIPSWKLKKKKKNKGRKRKLRLSLQDEIDEEIEEVDADVVAAEKLLHEEIALAGLEGLLPVSFGSSSKCMSKAGKKKKRRRTIDQVEHEEKDSTGSNCKTMEHDDKDSTGNSCETIGHENALSHLSPKKSDSVKNQRKHSFFNDMGQEDPVKEKITLVTPHLLDIETASMPMLPPSDALMAKYWAQRYRLFSLFDKGIRIADNEAWFSVTPEVIAQHIAERCRCHVVVDPFAGCGGNAIQLAFTCNHVIAIDIDPKKIDCARQNARVYGVEDRIDWIVGNAIDLLPSVKADVVFLSPPWGGPNYHESEVFDLNSIIIDGINGSQLYKMARKVTKNIAYFLPKNVSFDQMKSLSEGDVTCEYELNHLNMKLKTSTIYYGDLVHITGTESGLCIDSENT